MSDQNVDTPPSACEQLLDYVYGELDEAGRRAFEAHLQSCARCPTELQSFGRVRLASQRLLPEVEPTPALSGALHAQLMHAAAQRKPKGKLLAFSRKILAHPGWAAAAMFVIVGGAITVSVVRNQFMVPTSAVQPAPALSAPEASPSLPAEAAAPAARPAVGGSPQPAPAAQANLPASKNKESEPTSDTLSDGAESLRRHRSSASSAGSLGSAKKSSKGGAVADDARNRESKLELDLAPAGRLAVQPAPAPQADKARGATVAEGRDDGERATAQKTLTGVEGGAGPTAAAPPPSAPAAAMPPPPMKAVARPKPQAAPPPPAPMYEAQEPAAAEVETFGNRYDARQQPARTTAPRAKAAPAAPPAQHGYANEGGAAPSPVVAAASMQQRDVDQLTRADELARNNRCDEAAKLFDDLDRRGQRVPPKARANYLRCLSLLGRPDQAQQQLDVLKNDKSAPGTLVQRAEEELNNGAKKKAKKSAPADYATPAPAAAPPAATPAASSPKPAR